MKEITEDMAKALAKFQANAPKIDLDGEVKFKDVAFKYATLGNILTTIRPAMGEAGLSITQPIVDGVLHTFVIAPDGSSLHAAMTLPQTNDPKQLGGTITYYRRYMATSMLGLSGEKDMDAPEVVTKPSPNPKQMAQLIDKAQTGEADLLERAMAAFDLTADQVRAIVHAERVQPNEETA